MYSRVHSVPQAIQLRRNVYQRPSECIISMDIPSNYGCLQKIANNKSSYVLCQSFRVTNFLSCYLIISTNATVIIDAHCLGGEVRLFF